MTGFTLSESIEKPDTMVLPVESRLEFEEKVQLQGITVSPLEEPA